MKTRLAIVVISSLLVISANAAITTVGVYDEDTVNTDTVDAVAVGSTLDLALLRRR